MADNNPDLECCITTFILCALCALAYALFIAVIILSLYPHKDQSMGECHVTNALLMEFSYDEGNSSLHYNLALNVTIRNLNNRVVIDCENIEAKALYEDVLFGYSDNNNNDNGNISSFYIPVNTSYYLSTQFKGLRMILLHADQTSEYHKHKRSGIYNIEVQLYLINSGWRSSENMKICCNLKVPLMTASRTSTSFQDTLCRWGY